MAQVVPRSQHPISRKLIDRDALKVLYRLSKSGHTAYLVGGGVRDLLLARRPKDFDVGTSARPGEVKKLFRNCRLIGRRFRLAHIHYFGGTVIEVSTFRRQTEETSDGGDLMVRRDNTYGTPEQDARRRDFTINGLFYDIASFSVIDHVGGLEDLHHRVIRTIGAPEVRFREDPIRMLRAVKFAARLNFRISEEDLSAIHKYRGDLLKVAPERLNLEITRLLAGGYSHDALRLLRATGLLDVVLPEVGGYLAARDTAAEADDEPLWAGLKGLDMLVAAHARDGRSELPQSVLFGALLHPVAEHLRANPGFRPPARALPERPGVRYGVGFSTKLAASTRSSPPGANEAHRTPAPGRGPTGTEDHGAEAQSALHGLLAPMVQRLALPRRESDRLLPLLALHERLLCPPSRVAQVRGFARRNPALAEALLVLETQARGAGRHVQSLQSWRRVLPELEDWEAHRQPGRRRRGQPAPSAAPPKTAETAETAEATPADPTRKRRRKRRPRRRKRGPSTAAPQTS